MKHLNQSLRFLLLMTIITGLIYPAVITAVSKMIFPYQAGGSLISDNQGKVIGSELIAQDFKSEQYFHPRPSAVDFNPTLSGGSNLGLTSQDLLDKVNERKKQGATEDLLFASASGLDPHISQKTAADQILRVAQARHMDEKQIDDMVQHNLEGRQLGFLGEPRVNVLMLNLALDRAGK